jgi:hypothetical protein
MSSSLLRRISPGWATGIGDTSMNASSALRALSTCVKFLSRSAAWRSYHHGPGSQSE